MSANDSIEAERATSVAGRSRGDPRLREAKSREKADTVMQTRISRRHRDLIDDAAALRGVSRSTFVIDTLLEKSATVLLETRLFQLNEGESAALAAIFAEPPQPPQALRELMASKAPWEQ